MFDYILLMANYILVKQDPRIFGKVYSLAMLASLKRTGEIQPCLVRLDRARACYISSGQLQIVQVYITSGLRACGCHSSTILSGAGRRMWGQQVNPVCGVYILFLLRKLNTKLIGPEK